MSRSILASVWKPIHIQICGLSTDVLSNVKNDYSNLKLHHTSIKVLYNGSISRIKELYSIIFDIQIRLF